MLPTDEPDISRDIFRHYLSFKQMERDKAILVVLGNDETSLKTLDLAANASGNIDEKKRWAMWIREVTPLLESLKKLDTETDPVTDWNKVWAFSYNAKRKKICHVIPHSDFEPDETEIMLAYVAADV